MLGYACRVFRRSGRARDRSACARARGIAAQYAPSTARGLRSTCRAQAAAGNEDPDRDRSSGPSPKTTGRQLALQDGLTVQPGCQRSQDRKSVVQGKSVSVRVDLGGRRIIKKKKKK